MNTKRPAYRCSGVSGGRAKGNCHSAQPIHDGRSATRRQSADMRQAALLISIAAFCVVLGPVASVAVDGPPRCPRRWAGGRLHSRWRPDGSLPLGEAVSPWQLPDLEGNQRGGAPAAPLINYWAGARPVAKNFRCWLTRRGSQYKLRVVAIALIPGWTPRVPLHRGDGYPHRKPRWHRQSVLLGNRQRAALSAMTAGLVARVGAFRPPATE
jgi:hypothetical protein